MPDKIKFGDVGSDYEPSESDGEYSEGEKELLKSIRRRGRDKNDDDEQEEAVLGFDDEDDEDDDDEEPDFDDIRKFEHDSDIEEGGEEDDLPDRFAWGSKASAFYGTGYTDRDYDTLTAQEEELAQLEEAEALEIQKRLIQGMTAEDFQLDLLVPTEEGKLADEPVQPEGKSNKRKEKDRKKDKDEIVIKGDLSDLSERQQRDLFRKDAPEFEGLVNDFSTKMNACMEMEPVLELLKQHNKLQHPFGQLLTKRYELSLLYCNNINFYVLLKAQKVPVRNHPLVKRLLQLKRLVQEVEQKYEQSIKPQVEQLLATLEDGGDITFHEDDTKRSAARAGKAKGRRLKALERLEDHDQSAESLSDDEDDGGFDEESETEATSAKRIKLGANEDESDDDGEDVEENGENDNMDEQEEEEEGEDGDEKRKITYQMAKNRGLTARKRKDQRNVRVKNKQKYRKALIRRKGAVRPVRTELKRYAGETSIKAFVKRGIKIK